eukprot:2194040-Prymnesium_polylepis.2
MRAGIFMGAFGTALLSSRRSRMAVVTHGAISRSGAQRCTRAQSAKGCRHECSTRLRWRCAAPTFAGALGTAMVSSRRSRCGSRRDIAFRHSDALAPKGVPP